MNSVRYSHIHGLLLTSAVDQVLYDAPAVKVVVVRLQEPIHQVHLKQEQGGY